MKVLKIGKRIGSNKVHAVVYINGHLKMACKNGAQWIVVLEGMFCSEMKRHFLSQIF